MTLDELPIGKEAVILRVGGEGVLRYRLLDMGLIPKTKIMITKVAPMGDPIELRLRGYTLTIRLEDARNIQVIEEAAK
ncbi:ferrous iron transport protein A [Anaerotignum propionicum]|nr:MULTISPECIES: FeoA family protein [Anaerotignum]MCQ4937063.1 ferrous iron transport protein A [Anaerotignum propionicum]